VSVELDPRLSFDTFVVGAGNRMAATAAQAVAVRPGAVHNPLFIHGRTGLGKTHLLFAVGRLAAALQPQRAIEYLALYELVGQLLAMASDVPADEFWHRYERAGVLLVDDAQFLAGRRELQGELLRLFQRVQAAGGQVVVASDAPPAEIPDLDDRLAGLLSRGLVAEITGPSKEDPAPRAAERATGEFEDFLSEVTTVVQEQVESWQVRLREAIAYWNAEGYRTAVLERALALNKAPDVAGLLSTFRAAVDHLRDLERRAVGTDPALGADPVFRDPERMAAAEDLVERALTSEAAPPGPDPAFTRAAFEMGTSNQLASHVADAVIASPGVEHNPLLLHGASGVGKTHLLNAIGNALVPAHDGRRVIACVHARQFIDEMHGAVSSGTIDRWRARYRAVDVLLVDDVQHVAGAERAQEEFFFLFDDLVGAGKQVVLTSDQPPAAIPDLEARLSVRFEGGLVVPIQAPDRALREKLFARFLSAAGCGAGAPLLALLGQQPMQSVRDIAGFANRLAAAASAAQTPLDASLVRRELGAVPPHSGAPPVAPGSGTRDSAFMDVEKVVWDWPDVGARVIEEFR
jgi:chromosomal replication initiation ATPase DnaA